MNNNKINVGIIGLKPNSQWASRSHIPALRLLPDDFKITGVANTSLQSAQASASAFGIPHAFENPQALIESPEIDLVVITVKVPHHFELVKAALEAGKHVYCEHPIGNGFEETRQLTELAAKKNLIAVAGIQMVVAPEVAYLSQLINEGYLGQLLSTTLIGSGGSWANVTTAENYYLFEKSNGANMLTIPLGHTLAGFTRVLGGFENLSAQMLSRYREVSIAGTGEIRPKSTADQIMIIGTLISGAAAVIHYRGGVSKGTNLLWEIHGSEGTLQITGPIGHAQLAPLSIKGARGEEKELQVLPVPPEYLSSLPADPVVGNVARMYRLLAEDIRNGTHNAPSFAAELELYQLLNTIQRSAETQV